jgi:hypothetical protein
MPVVCGTRAGFVDALTTIVTAGLGQASRCRNVALVSHRSRRVRILKGRRCGLPVALAPLAFSLVKWIYSGYSMATDPISAQEGKG